MTYVGKSNNVSTIQSEKQTYKQIQGIQLQNDAGPKLKAWAKDK